MSFRRVVTRTKLRDCGIKIFTWFDETAAADVSDVALLLLFSLVVLEQRWLVPTEAALTLLPSRSGSEAMSERS